MEDIKKLTTEIEKIKLELVMEGYLDGWTIRHLKKKLKRLTEKLKILKEE